MAAFTSATGDAAVTIFNATGDTASLAAQLNEWGAHVETEIFAFNDMSTHNYAELRGAVMLQAGELQLLRDGLIQMEGAHARVQQFGSQAVAELDVLMQAFRAELVLSKSERVADTEAFKEELRQFTGHLQA